MKFTISLEPEMLDYTIPLSDTIAEESIKSIGNTIVEKAKGMINALIAKIEKLINNFLPKLKEHLSKNPEMNIPKGAYAIFSKMLRKSTELMQKSSDVYNKSEHALAKWWDSGPSIAEILAPLKKDVDDIRSLYTDLEKEVDEGRPSSTQKVNTSAFSNTIEQNQKFLQASIGSCTRVQSIIDANNKGSATNLSNAYGTVGLMLQIAYHGGFFLTHGIALLEESATMLKRL